MRILIGLLASLALSACTSPPAADVAVPTVSATSASTTTAAPEPVAAAPVAVVAATTIHGPITWYGPPDNDPPGSRAIAHPCVHQLAGGVGTYTDPITFATEYGRTYPYCVRIYVPSLRKYFIREDDCECSNAARHVDLFMDSGLSDRGVLACEDRMTPDGTVSIVLNPADNLPVDTVRMYPPCHTRRY